MQGTKCYLTFLELKTSYWSRGFFSRTWNESYFFFLIFKKKLAKQKKNFKCQTISCTRTQKNLRLSKLDVLFRISFKSKCCNILIAFISCAIEKREFFASHKFFLSHHIRLYTYCYICIYFQHKILKKNYLNWDLLFFRNYVKLRYCTITYNSVFAEPS